MAPAIAIKRRLDATEKFEFKLDVLEELLSRGELERFPIRASISTFATWEDAELAVLPLSRSVLYNDAPAYKELRLRMGSLLERLVLLRSKKGKRATIDSDLRLKLADMKARLQEYVSQYSTARAELVEARTEIERLNQLLARQIARRTKVVPLRGIASDLPNES